MSEDDVKQWFRHLKDYFNNDLLEKVYNELDNLKIDGEKLATYQCEDFQNIGLEEPVIMLKVWKQQKILREIGFNYKKEFKPLDEIDKYDKQFIAELRCQKDSDPLDVIAAKLHLKEEAVKAFLTSIESKNDEDLRNYLPSNFYQDEEKKRMPTSFEEFLANIKIDEALTELGVDDADAEKMRLYLERLRLVRKG